MAIESKYSQRKGPVSTLKKWMGKLASAQFTVFPVPGEEIFRSKAVNLPQLNYEIAANPRQANVLMVAGPIHHHLAQKVAIAWVQIPRPKALVIIDTHKIEHLPPPDFQIDMQENEFIQLKAKLQAYFANPFNKSAEALEVPFISEMLQEQNDQQVHEHHHGHGGGHQHGEEKHEPQHHQQENEEQDHQKDQKKEDHGLKEEDDQENKKKQSDQGKESKGHEKQENHESHEDHGAHEHQHDKHGGHGDGGFMSMVMMTKDMPRSMDGLSMEHNQAWFGPFFPGITGGLAFQFMLDGDTVMQVKSNKHLAQPDWKELCGIPARELPEKLAATNPLAPETSRILAEMVLYKLSGNEVPLSYSQINRLERERVCSHLNWLATMGKLTGNQWVYHSAGMALHGFQMKSNQQEVKHLVKQVLSFKYLRKKLMIGPIQGPILHHTSGPLARAAHQSKDIRADDENYRRLGFEIITLNENSNWGRLNIRLLEIEQSLGLIHKTENENKTTDTPNLDTTTGAAAFELETARGVSGINLEIKNGMIEQIKSQPVSNINLSIALEAVTQMEISDALTTIHSLDINPYEIIAND
ncbi:MAG: hypothetical protein ACNS62_13740 [Candidatus Cyclobacteriaceae bacterium M3_2C_046]